MPRLRFNKICDDGHRGLKHRTNGIERASIPIRAKDAGAIILAVLAGLTAARACGAKPDVPALLRQNDEVLLMAVHRGDRATWESMTTPDFAYIEAAEIWPKDVFLNGLGEDGKTPLVIRNYAVHCIGDTALVIHEDEVLPAPPMRTGRAAAS